MTSERRAEIERAVAEHRRRLSESPPPGPADLFISPEALRDLMAWQSDPSPEERAKLWQDIWGVEGDGG